MSDERNSDSSNLSNLFHKKDYLGVCNNVDLTREYSNNILDKIITSAIETNNSELLTSCKKIIDNFRWDWWTKKGNSEYHSKWKSFFEENKHLINMNIEKSNNFPSKNNFNIPEDIFSEIKCVDKLTAIKILKDKMGWSLKECKEWVDENHEQKIIESSINKSTEGKAINKTREKIQHENGDTYFGELKNNIYDGFGTYTWSNGDIYEGEFENGKFNGTGIKRDIDGDIRDGNWSNGRFISGKAKIVYKSGNIFEGIYENGKRHGRGKIFKPDGRIDFEGEFTMDIEETWFTEFYGVFNLLAQKYNFYNGDKTITNWFKSSLFKNKVESNIDIKNKCLYDMEENFRAKEYLKVINNYLKFLESKDNLSVIENIDKLVMLLQSLKNKLGFQEDFMSVIQCIWKQNDKLGNIELKGIIGDYLIWTINNLVDYYGPDKSFKYGNELHFQRPSSKRGERIFESSIPPTDKEELPRLKLIENYIKQFEYLNLKDLNDNSFISDIKIKCANTILYINTPKSAPDSRPRNKDGTLDKRYLKNR